MTSSRNQTADIAVGPGPERGATERTRARYQRIAPIYDATELLAERRYRPWRRELWTLARGPRILEVGVGTGKNMPFYPAGPQITAIDLTPGMLARARRRARDLGIEVQLREDDVQALDFPDDAFDTAVATFVFCSVPDPVLGLRELRRVVRPGGRILLLEHVRSEGRWLGRLMDLLDPLVVRLIGAHVSRRTADNVRRAGLKAEVEELAWGGIFQRIVAEERLAPPRAEEQSRGDLRPQRARRPAAERASGVTPHPPGSDPQLPSLTTKGEDRTARLHP
jgi:phosphatidylethanolamine/phosphatidyl-N-methylethanolamine N-methyltransferase